MYRDQVRSRDQYVHQSLSMPIMQNCGMVRSLSTTCVAVMHRVDRVHWVSSTLRRLTLFELGHCSSQHLKQGGGMWMLDLIMNILHTSPIRLPIKYICTVTMVQCPPGISVVNSTSRYLQHSRWEQHRCARQIWDIKQWPVVIWFLTSAYVQQFHRHQPPLHLISVTAAHSRGPWTSFTQMCLHLPHPHTKMQLISTDHRETVLIFQRHQHRQAPVWPRRLWVSTDCQAHQWWLQVSTSLIYRPSRICHLLSWLPVLHWVTWRP